MQMAKHDKDILNNAFWTSVIPSRFVRNEKDNSKVAILRFGPLLDEFSMHTKGV